jgi:hypothetical protein
VGSPEPASRPGDDRDLAVEAHCHDVSLRRFC